MLNQISKHTEVFFKGLICNCRLLFVELSLIFFLQNCGTDYDKVAVHIPAQVGMVALLSS